MTNDKKEATWVKGTKHSLNISFGTAMMFLGMAVLVVAAFALYQIAWHSPSAYQSYESGQICAVLKQHVCAEIGMAKFSLADPCGDRDAKCSAGDKSSGIYVYGVTTNDAKARLISLATTELEKSREVKALEVWFYDDVNNKHLVETKLIRRQQP